jgi:hypothetical protein
VHDLDKYLDELRGRFEFPISAQIAWATDAQIRDYFGGEAVWGAYHHSTHCIVISSQLIRAPKYVIRHLVLHETLHNLIQPTGCNWHSRTFRLAEQSSADYIPACRWLHKKAISQGSRTRLVSEKSSYWKRVIGTIYNYNYRAYRARRMTCVS